MRTRRLDQQNEHLIGVRQIFLQEMMRIPSFTYLTSYSFVFVSSSCMELDAPYGSKRMWRSTLLETVRLLDANHKPP